MVLLELQSTTRSSDGRWGHATTQIDVIMVGGYSTSDCWIFNVQR